VQGTSYAFGHIEVRYDPLAGSIGVSTHTPQTGWVGRAGPLPIVYAAGDQLGARAYSNGAVEVYKNGVAILLANTGDWPFAANGGRIGLTLGGTNGSTMDDFGGGNVVFPQNTPPTATITAPQDSVFVASGDTIRFAGSGGDAEDPPATLQLEWNVDLHHNNHTHPGTFVASGDSAELEIENHDDGTGVWWRASLRAADSGGLADTAYVDFFPDVELSPSDVTTVPGTPGTTAPATYSFRLRNLGRMPAPETRWRLVAAGVTLAEGDTLVAARDSVSVTRSLAPVLTEGDYTLRVVADTLGTALESNESNNANTRSLTVVAGAGPDELGPEITQGPTSEVSTTAAWIRWTTSERTGGIVRWGETRAFGDSLETPASLYVHFAALSGLAWATRCYFRVVALDSLLNPTPSTVDSFVTLNSSASADDRPLAFALRGPIPNPSRGAVELGLELAEGAGVRFAIHDLQGREVWSEPESERSAGRWTLRWPGTTASGAPQSPGLYWALVRVNGHSHLRRFALLR
jgi:hypothetical protein